MTDDLLFTTEDGEDMVPVLMRIKSIPEDNDYDTDTENYYGDFKLTKEDVRIAESEVFINIQNPYEMCDTISSTNRIIKGHEMEITFITEDVSPQGSRSTEQQLKSKSVSRLSTRLRRKRIRPTAINGNQLSMSCALFQPKEMPLLESKNIVIVHNVNTSTSRTSFPAHSKIRRIQPTPVFDIDTWNLTFQPSEMHDFSTSSGM